MDPMSFVLKPLRWLSLISQYQATTSGGPNFAYKLCTEALLSHDDLELDLSSWSLAFVGSETVRKDTLVAFSEAAARYRFNKNALYPCYGLAEASLFVSGGFYSNDTTPHEHPEKFKTPEQVSCGKPANGIELIIVDPLTRQLCPPREVGEVWLSGSSISEGYFNKPKLNEQVFSAQLEDLQSESKFLRTGDYGYLSEGELYVVGRLKDMMIINGKNVYPEDIESCIDICPHQRTGLQGTSAFSCDIESDEKLIVVQEVGKNTQTTSIEKIKSDIKECIVGSFGVCPHEILIIKGRGLPRTSSGKIQRSKAKTMYLNGHFHSRQTVE
ncbi:AMP-binding protein [Veronia nyctiphanis]|nr:AMP-binding protein [Veronia nyctiphanis]